MEAGMSTASEAAVPSAAPESKPEAVNLPEPAAKKKLPPKRKVAMHLAYLGAGYHGMQRNPGFPTIEADLETALVKAGAISDLNAGSFMKIHWMRAARTDKGVSAACQVVSAKLMVDPQDTFVKRVNAHLPDMIRVFGFQRATEGFDARKYCDKRKYEYILPAWVFDPQCCSTSRSNTDRDYIQAVAAAVLQPGQPAATAAAAGADDSSNGNPTTSDRQPPATADSNGGVESTDGSVSDAAAGGGKGVKGGEGGDETASSSKLGDEKLQRLRDDVAASNVRFTFGQEQLQQLNKVLAQYVGTHNFHNYTVRMLSSDPAARRYILSFTAELKQIKDQPWVKLVVVGQSFMLHQIRKMVGMAVAVMRGAAPAECISLALDPDRDLNTPMAPALGLFLDETYFDAYNKRFGDLHGPVTFEPFREAAEDFKAKHLYSHIADSDERELVNALWLRGLTDTYYKFSRWAKWPTVRNTAANIAANRAAAEARAAKERQKSQAKRPAAAAADESPPVAAGAADNSEGGEPASKQQRLERPGRLQGATAAMVVASQETYGMSPHKDTQLASAARQELKQMREEYQQLLTAATDKDQGKQQPDTAPPPQQPPQVAPADLDDLYAML